MFYWYSFQSQKHTGNIKFTQDLSRYKVSKNGKINSWKHASGSAMRLVPIVHRKPGEKGPKGTGKRKMVLKGRQKCPPRLVFVGDRQSIAQKAVRTIDARNLQLDMAKC